MDWEDTIGEVQRENLRQAINNNATTLGSFYKSCLEKGMSELTAKKLTSQLWEKILWGGKE